MQTAVEIHRNTFLVWWEHNEVFLRITLCQHQVIGHSWSEV